ncbi:hypothetical protein CPB86DRAFT_750555 [Serendipita vermifera]|nr:hypothetical protein CPB86DRAFT_750555 [Serendipita vermifera]
MPVTQTTLKRACAECKRLKLKCDKNVPCSACVRRGCASICPDGQLIAGKGTRFVLTSTKELHDEIEKLQTRIQELEEALAELQSQVSSKPHPLLAQSLRTTTERPQPDGASDEDELIDTFGSLTIDTKGETVWYGPYAGSEFLIPRNEDNSTTETYPELPVEVLLLSKQFPFKNIQESEETLRKLVRNSLPCQDVAFEITYSHHARFSWTKMSVVWENFRQTILEPIYLADNTANDQQVAVLFISLALAILADPKRPMFHPDAQRYYQLSRASISLGEDIFQSRSLYAIEYLQLLAGYHSSINDPEGANKTWGVLCLAIRLAQTVYWSQAGLHRDYPQWDKYPEQAERRRRIWWELVAFETSHGFCMGQPRAIYPTHYDTKMPHDDEDEGKPPTVNRIRYRWTADCLGRVLDEAFAVKPPSYATIMKLDKALREWDLASVLLVDDLTKTRDNVDEQFLPALIRSLSTIALRELALMYLHRRHFVQALAKESHDPLSSKFAMSVLAVHRSAILVLQRILHIDDLVEHLLLRVSFMWSHALSAYVCLCAIVIKSPGCSLAQSSLVEIDRIKYVFARVTAYRVSHAQRTVVKLYEQAHLAMRLFQEGKWSMNGARDEIAADVMKFVGRADFAPTPTHGASTSNSYSGIPLPDGVHPVLFEYMKRFEKHPERNHGPTSSPPARPSATLGLPTHQINPIIPGLATSNNSYSGNSTGLSIENSDVADGNSPHFRSLENPNLVTVPSGGALPDQLSAIEPLQGIPSSGTAYDILYEGTYPSLLQRVDPLHPDQRPPQDQVWEQFLYALMSPETLPDSTPTQ